MTQKVWRLTLDENGVENVIDYTSPIDALDAVSAAKRRAAVFFGRLEYLIYDGRDAVSVKTIETWEQ